MNIKHLAGVFLLNLAIASTCRVYAGSDGLPEDSAGGQNTAVVAVVASGTGLTENAALKAALRSAVEIVIGQVIDAQTLVENDELVEDKILTYANGFVKTYQQIGDARKSDEGLVSVKIRAVVEKGQLAKKIQKVTTTSTPVSGESLFAELATRQQSIVDAKVMAEDLFRDIPLKILKAKVMRGENGKPKISLKPATGELFVDVEMGIDPEKYKAWTADLMQKLAKMSSKTEMGGFYSGEREGRLGDDQIIYEFFSFENDNEGLTCVVVLIPTADKMYDFTDEKMRFQVKKYYLDKDVYNAFYNAAFKNFYSGCCAKTTLVGKGKNVIAQKCGGEYIWSRNERGASRAYSQFDNMAQYQTPGARFSLLKAGRGGNVSVVFVYPGWSRDGYIASKYRMRVNMGNFSPEELREVDSIECEPVICPQGRWEYD